VVFLMQISERVLEDIILISLVLLISVVAVLMLLVSTYISGKPEADLIRAETKQAKKVLQECHYVECAEAFAHKNYLRDWESYSRRGIK